jgi:hypothetical protein
METSRDLYDQAVEIAEMFRREYADVQEECRRNLAEAAGRLNAAEAELRRHEASPGIPLYTWRHRAAEGEARLINAQVIRDSAYGTANPLTGVIIGTRDENNVMVVWGDDTHAAQPNRWAVTESIDELRPARFR